MSHEYNLSRFVEAQAPVFNDVCQELADGLKRTHWMWFIFPQLRCLGRSSTAQYYGIDSLDEARAYLSHPLLGPRLRQAAELVNNVNGRSVHQIFGSPDDMKFHSCVTLFAHADPTQPSFTTALVKYFDGVPDGRTIELLA